MKKRDYFLLITLFLILFSINLNAQLPDIRLEAKAEGNNVILNWVYYIPCEENWQCSDWSSCVNNKQTRTCNDLNDCNTFINKPSETKICISTQKTKEIEECINECSVSGLKECSGNAYHTCGDYNSDSCLEFGTLINCASNQQCVNGKCIIKEETAETAYVIRNDLAILGDELTSNSILDILKKNFDKINIFSKKNSKIIGIKTEHKKIVPESDIFEIYRNNILINKDIKDKYCNGNNCFYKDLNLDPGKYEYYIKILNYDETESKISNTIELVIRSEEVVDAYITLATTKENYPINEKIELTDPPQNSDKDINRILRGTGISKDFVMPGSYGYIIQFDQEPVLVRKAKLQKGLQKLKEDSIDYKQNYEDSSINALNFIYKYPSKQINKYLYSISQKNYIKLQQSLDNEILDYRKQLRIQLDNNINEVKKELNLDENKIKRKFEGELFNGIVLVIDEKQANEVKKLSNVKGVFPNEPVQLLLDKSVLVIKGDLLRKELGLTGTNVTVAVIDTGIDPNHESLGDLDDNPSTNDHKIIGFKDFVNFRQEPYDDHFHGTHVSGICCGTGGKDHVYVGVAPQSNLVGVKVLDNNGWGTYDQVIAGMEWVAQNKDKYNIKIASMSLGGRAQENDPMEYAANALVDYGVTLVVAAGNSGPSPRTISSPGTAEKVITVGAIDNNLEIASFSSRGPTLDGRIKPDITAPGVNINAPQLDTINKYWKLSGTSMATPHVSGAIALLYEYQPGFDDQQIKYLLYNSAVDSGETGRDNNYGYGVIDLANAAIQLNQPDHEISVYDIILGKKFVELNENIKIKVLIKNFGKNIENNLNVSLYINNIYYNSIILNNLNINELKEIEFNYAPTNIGENTIKIEVQSIPGELFKSNNQLSRNLKVFEKIKGRIKALVLDSWGVDYSGYSIFDELNENWFDYGDYLINIDYKTLNKEDISYEDIKATNADILIISDAWDNGRYTGNDWEYTNNEIESIKKYVNEGHGIVATSGTFSELVPNNMKLASLFGIDQSKIGNWADIWSNKMKILYKDNLMFNKIPNLIYFTPTYYNNNDLELNTSQNGVLLAISTDNKAKIIFYNENTNNIYLTSIEELNTATGFANNKLIFYNSLVLASLNVSKSNSDLRLFDLKSNDIAYFGENTSVKAKIISIGQDEDNIVVDLLVNNIIKDSISIPNLIKNKEKELNFTYEPKLGINNISIYAHELPLEINVFDNHLNYKSFAPRAVIKSLNDYGLDTNNDDQFNYLVLNVTLDILEDGYYYIMAESLNSNFGAKIPIEIYSYSTFMNKGYNTISLLFDGLGIRKFGLNGPYKFKNIYIIDRENIKDTYPEYITQPYKYGDFQLSSDISISVNIPYEKAIKDLPLDISLIIENEGIETAHNVTLDVYKRFYNRTSEYKILMLHQNFSDMKTSEKIDYDFIFTPDLLGDLCLEVVANASNDLNQKNNEYYQFFYVIPNGPDLMGGFNDYGSKILNTENKINAFVRNVGIKPITESKASLYLVDDYYRNDILIENLTLIQEINTGSLAVDETKDINFLWTPNKIGNNRLKIEVKSPEDLNLDNNIDNRDFFVTYNAPDVWPYIFTNYLWIVNKDYTIELQITNQGPKDANNVSINLYLKEDNTTTLILSKFYPIIKTSGWKNEILNYKIDKIGYFLLSLEATTGDENEIKDNNIYTTDIHVIPDEADLTINYINYENRNFLVDEHIKLFFNIYNQGSKTAENVYLYSYLKNNNELQLLNKIPIQNISPNKNIYLESNITLNKLGWNNILFTINSSNDSDFDNNIYESYFKIVPKSLIMNLEDRQISGYLLIDIYKYNYNNATWILYQNVLDDTKNNNLRYINANSYLALDKIFNPHNIVINDIGRYEIYVAFVDENRDVIKTKSEGSLELSYRFYVS